MTNTNNNFVSTEVDLDRDVPGDEAFFAHNNMVDNDEVDVLTGHFDVDVDEKGPFITHSIDEDSFDFDAYCEANPNFNAAINGHQDWI